MHFRLIGGYAINPTPSGAGTVYPPMLEPHSVEANLLGSQGPQLLHAGPTSGTYARMLQDLRRFVVRYDVAAVAFAPEGEHAAAIERYLRRALGPPRYQAGGAEIWIPGRGGVP